MPLLDHFHPPLNLRRHWNAFLQAWATYISSDLNRLLPEVGLVIVDVVTDRHGNLHRELLERLAVSQEAEEAELYAVAYRPVLRGEQTNLAIWPSGIHLGQPLPTLPLWLRGEYCLRVDLESAYERTCQEQRVSL